VEVPMRILRPSEQKYYEQDAMTKQTQNEGIYLSLVSQLDKLARHNRQGSFRTKERYYLATKRFCLFLAEAYHLQKLANISGKHLVHYVRYMQEKGYSASTVKQTLPGFAFSTTKSVRPNISCQPTPNWGQNWSGGGSGIQTGHGAIMSSAVCWIKPCSAAVTISSWSFALAVMPACGFTNVSV